jgi:hypothetical protein
MPSQSKAENEKIVGTNCYNCKYVEKTEPVNPNELNNEGGIDPKNEEEMKRAEKADLITLPGGDKSDSKNKALCGHPKVNIYVTPRMCCAFWDNNRVKRPWKQTQST